MTPGCAPRPPCRMGRWNTGTRQGRSAGPARRSSARRSTTRPSTGPRSATPCPRTGSTPWISTSSTCGPTATRRGTRGVARSDESRRPPRHPTPSDAWPRLGRTSAERDALTQALRSLDARHRLVAKIAAEPGVEAIVAEFVGRLMNAFGALSAIRGLAVLDVPSGSNSSRSPVTGRRTAEFEPWMCRLLLELGARPVGIDIGDLTGEAFEHHNVDLGVPGALDFLPTAAFDAIHESRLFGSPEFRAAHGRAADRIRRRDPSAGAATAAAGRDPHPQRWTARRPGRRQVMNGGSTPAWVCRPRRALRPCERRP